MQENPAFPSNRPLVVWFRRSLRLSDHAALHAAAQTGAPVLPVYILDDETPGEWRMGGASRWWLAQSLVSLSRDLAAKGSRLILRRGRADDVLLALARETGARGVYFTRGYEPFQRPLEERLKQRLDAEGLECRRFGGHLLFEPEHIQNKSGEPFRVYTPFFRSLSAKEPARDPLPAPGALIPPEVWPGSCDLESWSLEPKNPDWAGGLRETWTCGESAAQQRLSVFVDGMLSAYGDSRNTPGVDGTSRLSPHLAFGEISPHQVWHAVQIAADRAGKPQSSEAYLREIVWREFSYHLLFHFPTLPEKPFRPEFTAFPWSPDKTALEAWRKGRTGYPIVDAGMRQLWETGWMHNRVRMITASLLIKHLLVPWTAGAAWFWDTLVDADLASNSASWQWVAGSGADAAPYFRIFNPVLQGEKFDPNGDYVRRYVPELAKLAGAYIHKPWEAPAAVLAAAGVRLGVSYPAPVIEHARGRQRALAAFATLQRAG